MSRFEFVQHDAYCECQKWPRQKISILPEPRFVALHSEMTLKKKDLQLQIGGKGHNEGGNF